MTTPTFCPFLAAGKFTLHSLCLNQELGVCSFLTLGYFLIGMAPEARHRGANISLSTSQQRERNKRRGVGTRQRGGKKREFFTLWQAAKGSNKKLGKTMGNPLRDGQQPMWLLFRQENLIFLYLARNQCKFASRFLFCGCRSNWNWGCARLNPNGALRSYHPVSIIMRTATLETWFYHFSRLCLNTKWRHNPH